MDLDGEKLHEPQEQVRKVSAAAVCTLEGILRKRLYDFLLCRILKMHMYTNTIYIYTCICIYIYLCIDIYLCLDICIHIYTNTHKCLYCLIYMFHC